MLIWQIIPIKMWVYAFKRWVYHQTSSQEVSIWRIPAYTLVYSPVNNLPQVVLSYLPQVVLSYLPQGEVIKYHLWKVTKYHLWKVTKYHLWEVI